jgi:hypothetical protein
MTGSNMMLLHHILAECRNVQEILDNQYPQRWIGRGGPHHWPARSPDLNLNHLSAAHKSRG